METSAIQNKKLKNLSSQKKIPPKSVRSVLGNYEPNYRPIVNDEETDILTKMLEEVLPSYKRLKKSIPWSQIKDVSFSERKVFRQNYYENEISTTEISQTSQKLLIRGINAVMRGLEKKDIVAVLLSSDIQPVLMIKPIISLCLSTKVFVLMLPMLRDLTKKTLGHSCIVLGINKQVKSDDCFWNLIQKIGEISNKYQEKLLNSSAGKKQEDSIECTEDEKNVINKNTSASESQENSTQVNKEENGYSKFYLYRNSCKERIFIPKSDKDNSSSIDFIPLMNTDIPNEDKNLKKNVTVKRYMEDSNYVPMKIKKMKGNSKRKNKK